MKIIIVRVGNIKAYPPTISLVNALLDMNHEVVVITTLDSVGFEKSFLVTPQIEYVDFKYSDNKSMIQKISKMHYLGYLLWKCIENYYSNDCLIWCEDDLTIKHLGYRLLKYKYILRLDELNESLYYTIKFKQFHFNTEKLGNGALAVVVPEYNRAHITKVWWGLSELPSILPNKPYPSYSANSFELNFDVEEKLQEIEKKKIVLYQGMLGSERPIEPFIEAVEGMEDYTFLILSNNSEYLKKQYDNCYVLSFIQPPFHLEVTRRARIGIIAYQPDKKHNSVLNTIYCAPNKSYEYAYFGLPILSNDLPGMKAVFDKYNSGISVDTSRKENIIDAMRIIDQNYEEYSNNAVEMYNGTDFLQSVTEIINKAIKKMK